MNDPTEPAVVKLVADVARLIEPRLPGLINEIVGVFLDKIPQLRIEDQDVQRLLHASALSNATAGMSMYLHNIPVERIEVPAAAAHYARRLAQRGVPVEALLRAYQIGQALFVNGWLEVMGPLCDDPRLLLRTARLTMDRACQYTDRVSVMVVEIYEEERTLWAQQAAAARTVHVRTVLAKEELDAAAAEVLIGYPMHGTHLGVVVQGRAEDDGREVKSVVRLMAEATGARPFTAPVDDRTLWAWVPGPRATAGLAAELDDALRRGGGSVRIALGNPATGLQGFRSSHREALSAQHVAEIRGDSDTQATRVTAFADVAVSAFLARDLGAARRWVSSVLGGLAVDDASMAELRRTVLSYLRTGASLTEAAARLHLHKNTVRYRLCKAKDIRGRPINESRIDLEVALRACEHLGRKVLAPSRDQASNRLSG